MKKYLFVGGKADGHMIDVKENYSHWQVPYIEQPFQCPYEDVGNYSIPFKVEVYRKVRWESGENQQIEFFALDSMNSHEVTRLFFENYRPKQDVEIDDRIESMKNLLYRCLSILDDSLQRVTDSGVGRKIWDFSLELSKFLHKMDKN